MSTTPLPTTLFDFISGTAGGVTEFREQLIAPSTRLAGGHLYLASPPPWYRDASSGGGSVVVASGAATIASGTVVAGVGSFVSRHTARLLLGSQHEFAAVLSVSTNAAGGRYRWGAYDSSNGYFFEFEGTVARIISRKNGVDAIVTVFTGTQPFLIDTNRHAYVIRYTAVLARWIQDANLKHSMFSSAIGPLVVNPNLPVTIEAANLSAPGTNFVVTATTAFIRRSGGPAPDAETAAITRVATSTASAMLIDFNPMRRTLLIFNDSNRILYLKFGTTASIVDYTLPVPPNDRVVIQGSEWSGRVDGILNTGTGFAQVTETSE